MNVSQNILSPAVVSQDEDALDLRTLAATLWRGKLWIAAVAAVFAILGGIYAYQIATPKYRANSVIVLDGGRDQLLDIGTAAPTIGSDLVSINTELQVLRSRRLIERVVQAGKLTENPEFNPFLQEPGFFDKILGRSSDERSMPSQDRLERIAIGRVLARLSARNVSRTRVIRITAETESARSAAMLADLVAQQYILHQMDVKFEATREASEWLSDRVADLKVELETSEGRLAEYASRSDVVSEETLQLQDRQLKDLRERLDTIRENYAAAVATVTRLEGLATAPAAQKAREAGDSQLSVLFGRDGDSEMFRARFEQLLERAQVQVGILNNQQTTLVSSIASLEQQIAKQSEELIELQQLTRDAQASRLLYEYFLGRLKETSAQEGIQRADSRILSNAVVPGGPSEPRKQQVIIITALFGALLGAGLVLLREMTQNTYRQASELEAETGIPVMGQVPLIKVSTRRDTLEYLDQKPTSAAAESIRNLRTSVLLSDVDHTPEVLMVTSSLPGEGKTTISFSLAQNLVGMGKKVLLVEGDIRRQVFSQYLNVKGAKGMMSVLSGDSHLTDVVIFDPVLGADILISEQTNVNAADVLSSHSFQNFVETARQEYDVVIIDTPPVLVVPDSRVVSQHVDMTLFTVRWDSTSKAQLRESLRMFETVGSRVHGLVLNQIDPTGMKRYGYGENYGAYGSYGSKYYTE